MKTTKGSKDAESNQSDAIEALPIAQRARHADVVYSQQDVALAVLKALKIDALYRGQSKAGWVHFVLANVQLAKHFIHDHRIKAEGNYNGKHAAGKHREKGLDSTRYPGQVMFRVSQAYYSQLKRTDASLAHLPSYDEILPAPAFKK